MSVLLILMDVTIILYASTILVHMSANAEVDSSYQVIKGLAQVNSKHDMVGFFMQIAYTDLQ